MALEQGLVPLDAVHLNLLYLFGERSLYPEKLLDSAVTRLNLINGLALGLPHSSIDDLLIFIDAPYQHIMLVVVQLFERLLANHVFGHLSHDRILAHQFLLLVPD